MWEHIFWQVRECVGSRVRALSSPYQYGDGRTMPTMIHPVEACPSTYPARICQ